jgi:hypothetical protein
MKAKALLFISAIAVACGGQTIGDVDAGQDAAAPCTTSAQCGKGICGFAQSAGCAAQGQCFPMPGAMCNGYSPGCSCSGDTINVMCTGLPDGYTTEPFAHVGSCVDATTVAFPCGTVDCVPGQDVCYIPANSGTDAGACMPANGCADCNCAQAMFQCISTCQQNGPAIYVHCQ